MKLPAVSIIAAMTLKGVIGNQGTMPWKSLKRDMDRFRKLTAKSAVVMGPKTYESIGSPLKGRLNIIITTNRKYEAPPGVFIAHDPQQALEYAAIREYAEFFAIGGAMVYSSFLSMPQAEHLFLTHVNTDMEGDTHFPHWNSSEWRKAWEEKEWTQGEGDDYPTRFAEYRRVPTTKPFDTQLSWPHPREHEWGVKTQGGQIATGKTP